MKTDRKPNGDKIMADDHADYNNHDGKYKNVDEQETDVNAADHADYINRDAAFAEKGGCVYIAHHLPKWANESPKAFFAAAAAHEESEHTYKEFEFALQNELSLKQNLEIVQAFIEKNFSDYYYAYAIHNKEATLGNGEKNPHCHFMFSIRKMDDLEKERERAPECFFKKARRVYEKKDGSVTDNRRLGGCKVLDIWNKFYTSSEHLRYLRKDFAQTTNRVLEKYHIPARVDHRSNKELYEEALKENDEFRAQLYALPPEQHLGPEIANNPNDPRVIALKEQRKLRYETIRMIEGISRLEHLAEDYKLAEKQKNLTNAAAEIAESTREITIDETICNDVNEAELNKNCAAAASGTDEKLTAIFSFSDAIAMARHAEMSPQELAEETALRQICQEKAALQKKYDDLEARKKSLRAAMIADMMKDLPDYNKLAAIENADTDGESDNSTAIQKDPISLETVQSKLAANTEYADLQAKLSDIAEELNEYETKVAAQTQRMREINLRLNLSENKKKIHKEALRLFAENQNRRNDYQESSLQEISLLKQKIQITGTKIAALQEDVILYRQAIEKAKDSYLNDLKASAEMTLPEIEEKIAASKKRIAEKQSAESSTTSPEGEIPTMPKINAGKVLLSLPAGYDNTQCRIWVTKIETVNKKLTYQSKLPNGAWVGNYSGRETKNPGQFYVSRPEADAVYAVWRKDLTIGKSEMIAKAKYTSDAMQPLPLPEETRLLDLEKQRQTLLEQKEYLAIFQKNKLVSQTAFELKKELQQLEKQKRKASASEIQSLELRYHELTDKLEKRLAEKKECHEKMQDIRKLFATKDVKSALTKMANDITQGDVPNKQVVEALQSGMAADVERTRAILATRIRLMNDQAIAERLTDANLSDALARQRHKTERRYTAMEVRKTIYDCLAAIRVEKQAVEKQLAPLEERYVSEARARKMAIDLYTENKTKELRNLNYAIKKKDGQLQKAEEKLLTKEYALLNTKKPKWYDRALGNEKNEQYNADRQEITSWKQQVAQDKAALYSLQTKASQTESALNNVLKLLEATEKIEKIVSGILKKNHLVADQVFALRARKTQLSQQEAEFIKLASAATRQIEADRGRNITYAPSGSTGTKNEISIAAIIAKAFDGNGAACSGVTRMNADDKSLLDWDTKDAAERKAQRRESAWNRDEF